MGKIGKMSEEHKMKISSALKGVPKSEEHKMNMRGKKHSEEHKKNLSQSWDYNKHFTKEVRLKLSKSHKGKKPHQFTEETRLKMSLAQKGKPAWNKGLTKETDERVRKYSESQRKKIVSEECKRKMSIAKKGKYIGENHPNWHGGISFEPYGLEFNDQLKENIRRRDNFTCQECGFNEGQLKCKLDVHHIDFNKKNSQSDNLISLCKSCHTQTQFNRQNWIDYFRNKIS